MITTPIITDENGVRSPASFPNGYTRIELIGDMAVFYLPGDALPEMPPITPDPPSPDWVGFRRAMLINPHYAGIAESYWQVTRVENAIMAELPDLHSLKILWNQLIDVLETPPSEAAIEGWNNLAQTFNIPLVFDVTGDIS